ncbi:MAG: TIGR00282 family metallophosphoesterase [Candidatus Fimivivens sp.]
MNILMLGDVVGQGGCEVVREHLPRLKRHYGADTVIINGENSAQGNGILPSSAKHLFDSGANVITTGNHVFRRREIYELLDQQEGIIRPANFSAETPGSGVYMLDMLRCRIAVVNLMGTAGMEPLANPFDTIDKILETLGTPNIILDFHAETTSEKRAMGFYLDGRISLLAGTHTHVQTADEQILPNGTGYITDLGMCGPKQSVLGVKPEQVIARFRTAMPTRFENPDGEQIICGIAVEIDERDGKTKAIERIYHNF